MSLSMDRGTLTIPHSRPCLDDNDCRTVIDVLVSGQLAQGKKVAALEDAFVRLMSPHDKLLPNGFSHHSGLGRSSSDGLKKAASGFHRNDDSHPEMASCQGRDGDDGLPAKSPVFQAAAVNSGTAALHLTLLALGIGSGDEVIIPSYACTALWHAVRYTRAMPVLADSEGATFNIAAGDVQRRRTDRTRAVIVPHLFGQAAELNEILALDIPVIEDCAQALGSTYQGRPTGSFGVAAVFSFYATKVISAGEGGMVVSRNAALVDKIRDLRDYDERDDLNVIRFNCKLTDIQAALALSQLHKLPSFIDRRREIAGRYDRLLHNTGLPPPLRKDDRDHIFFRYVVCVAAVEAFIAEMENRGVSCRRPVFKPLNSYLNIPGYDTAEWIWRHAVSIPLYPGLNEEELVQIMTSLEKSAYLHR